MAYDHDQPILTMNEVRMWREEKKKVEQEIKTREERLVFLTRKLSAADFLIQSTTNQANPTTHAGNDFLEHMEVASASKAPLTNALERVLHDSDEPMTRPQIKEALGKLGYTKSQLGNYFYTVLLRLQNQRRITRNGDLFAIAQRHMRELENTETPSDA